MIAFEYILLVISILILISVVLTRYSENFGLPSLVLFLVIGMLAGSDGPGNIHFDNVYVAQYVGIVALIFILFSGGLETRWKDVKPVAWRAFTLSTLGICITVLVLGSFIHYFLKLGFAESFLISAIVSSTDAAAVFSVLRARGTHLKGRLKSLLELESGSNDPAAIILTVMLIEVILSGEINPGKTLLFLIMQLGIGALLGYFAGKLMVYSLNKFKFSYPSLYPVYAIAASIFIYSLTVSIGGSGILAVYITAVVLGSSEFIQKKTLIRFFDGLALLGQIVVFLTLGLLVFPSQLYNVIIAGLIVSAVLIFAARPAAVFFSLIRSGFGFREKTFVSWVGLRGAVPVILATFPLAAGLEIGHYIFNLIFFVTLTSALIQGWSIPLAAKVMGLKEERVKKAKIPMEITDSIKTNNELVDVIIPANSDAVGKSLAELNLPAGTLVTVIYRDDEYIVPSGSSTLEAGDTVLILINKDNIEETRKVFSKKKEE